MKLTAGIDFGTTNTALGYSQAEGNVVMARIGENGESTTDRTAIFYDFSNIRNPIIGEEGRRLYIEGEEGKLITSPKSFLKAQELPKVGILRQRYDLVEIISHILIEFKSRLEKQVGESIDSILVGRPVKFHDTKPELDRLAQERLEKAFRLAGFKNVEFQYEPIAAYNSFVHSNPGKINSGDTTLVVDLGGGTSDFSVVLQGQKESQVIGNGGVYVGGDDIDQKLIFSHYSDYFGKIIRDIFPLLVSEQDKIEFGRLNEILDDLGLGYYLHFLVEQAKIDLTEQDRVVSDFNMFRNAFTTDLSRIDFDELISEEVTRISQGIQDVLTQTGVSAQSINHVVLNGGTSYIPIIQKAVEGLIGT